MKIPEFNTRNARPWMIRRPWLGRMFAILLLSVSWFIFPVMILWENRDQFSEIGVLFLAAFGKWTDTDE